MQKWVTKGAEIDIFEIMTVLAIYARCTNDEKCKFLYQVFSYEENGFMTKLEFRFFTEKFIAIISSHLSLKRSYLSEALR